MMESQGPKRTLMCFSSNVPPADSVNRLVPAQTISSAGRSVMTAVSLDAMQAHIPQPLPTSALACSAVLPHRPVASTSIAPAIVLQHQQQLQQASSIAAAAAASCSRLVEEEQWGRRMLLDVQADTHEMLMAGARVALATAPSAEASAGVAPSSSTAAAAAAAAAASKLQRVAGADGSGSKHQQRKVMRLEDAAPPRSLHFAFVPWRDDVSAAAAARQAARPPSPSRWALGVGARASPASASGHGAVDRAVLLELLARGTPLTGDGDLRAVLGVPEQDLELALALMEQSLSALLGALKDGAAGTAHSSNSTHRAQTPLGFSPTPTAGNGSSSSSSQGLQDLSRALGAVCATTVKLLQRFAPTGCAVGTLDAWLRGFAYTAVPDDDVRCVLSYVLQLVQQADLRVCRWLTLFLATVPPTVFVLLETAGYFCHLLTHVCLAVCGQMPLRLELTGAALPLVVQLLTCASVQHSLKTGAVTGAKGHPSLPQAPRPHRGDSTATSTTNNSSSGNPAAAVVAVDVDAVVQFAGLVESQLHPLGGGHLARRLAEHAAELAALVQPLLAMV